MQQIVRNFSACNSSQVEINALPYGLKPSYPYQHRKNANTTAFDSFLQVI